MLFKTTAFFAAAAALATSLVQAAPMLAERSPPSLSCAPSSLWTNGSLYLNGEFGSIGPGQLGIRTFTNHTTGKKEQRLTTYVSGRSDIAKLNHVSAEYCNSTTFNYTYQLPMRDFEKNEPLRLRTLDFGTPSGFGYNYSTCLGVGTSYDEPRNPKNQHLRTTGNWPISVQECENTDFDQSPATQAQFFQQVFKYNFITTANGVATGQNPPTGWSLVVDDKTGDIHVTSNHPHSGSGNAFYITANKHGH